MSCTSTGGAGGGASSSQSDATRCVMPSSALERTRRACAARGCRRRRLRPDALGGRDRRASLRDPLEHALRHRTCRTPAVVDDEPPTLGRRRVIRPALAETPPQRATARAQRRAWRLLLATLDADPDDQDGVVRQSLVHVIVVVVIAVPFRSRAARGAALAAAILAPRWVEPTSSSSPMTRRSGRRGTTDEHATIRSRFGHDLPPSLGDRRGALWHGARPCTRAPGQAPRARRPRRAAGIGGRARRPARARRWNPRAWVRAGRVFGPSCGRPSSGGCRRRARLAAPRSVGRRARAPRTRTSAAQIPNCRN